jgi:hypothetical protein
VHLTDSGNHAVAHGSGLDPRTHRMLEHGAQKERSQAYEQRRGNRSGQPPSPARLKFRHRRKEDTYG